MTDDASPENLRKFLESDDPALVRMGLSMAKGAGVEVTVEDLKHFLKSDNTETVRTGFMLAEEIGMVNEAINMLFEEGDYDYQILADVGEPVIETLTRDLMSDENQPDRSYTRKDLLEILILHTYNHPTRYRDDPIMETICDIVDEGHMDGYDSTSLGGMGYQDDREFAHFLIEFLSGSGYSRAADSIRRIHGWNSSDGTYYRVIHGVADWCYEVEGTSREDSREFADALEYCVQCFGTITEGGNEFPLSGDKAMKRLIRELDEDNCDCPDILIKTLGEIGDKRAVEPLIERLKDEVWAVTNDTRLAAAEALDKLGWVPENDGQRSAYLIASKDWKSLVEWGRPAVEPLIEALRDNQHWERRSAAEALGKIGDARAVEPLIKALGDEFDGARDAAKEALRELGHEVK
jgi:hypothetical protein